ncbi:hypothetical protein CORC01_09906 [Colletotrichum orchidophilum]|uniref:Uncharacterized protein n=1 Tax=Colletotrichum orchidophilum TaxID=1209926 RepID=A0A1G4B055_9PEZI|nr:uncharacterized protein CORC01_09906 [Colletotrichum orchidophilum]OHE94799.1 hypothetical protein CORC01_09906 [Colletotrichum orchidophilum]
MQLVSSIAGEKFWSVAATEESAIFTNKSDGLDEFLLNGGSCDFGDDMPTCFNKLVQGQVGNGGLNSFLKPSGLTKLAFRSHPRETSDICNDVHKERYPPRGNIVSDTVAILDSDYPSTSPVPENYDRMDEWYAYKTDPANDPAFKRFRKGGRTYIDEFTPSPELQHMSPM